MIFLLLSIFCSTILILGFKLFEKFEIDTFHAIVVNYIVCVIVGLPLVESFSLSAVSSNGWIPLGLLLGVLFISLFFLIGITTQRMGVSVATVSMKLGYILPIILAFTFYQETITTVKVIGVLLTILAVIFTSLKEESNEETGRVGNRWTYLLFPFIIFIGSGVADSIVQYTKKTFFDAGGFEVFNIVLFATAALIGLVIAVYGDIRNGASKFNKKNILAGVLLGIPNYGSIYFLFKSLSVPGWESSMVFPVNNVCIVVCSSVLAVLLFKERLNKFNHIGLALAVVSIVLMAKPLRDFVLNWF